MDMLFVVRQRLEELGLEQKDLAAAAEVTESYISQLLTRKKAPPSPERTDIYFKLESFLKLPRGRLSRLAELQRNEELKRKVVDPPAPLFKEVREVILQKCVADKGEEVRAIFERHPFGELERLVTQKILDVVKDLAREELDNQEWLQEFARLSDLSYEEVRVKILEFLDTDVFHVSTENCVSFLDPLIETWDIDLKTFGIEILLNRRLVAGRPRRFDFVEQGVAPPVEVEPGLEELPDTEPQLAETFFGQELFLLQCGDPTGVGDHIGFEVQHTLEILERHVQQISDTAGQTLEEPYMGYGRGQLDVAHAFPAHLGQGDLDATLVTDDVAVLHPLVLAAKTLPIHDGSEGARAEEAVLFRLECPVVDGFRFRDFTKRPGSNLFGRRERNSDRFEFIDRRLTMKKT